MSQMSRRIRSQRERVRSDRQVLRRRYAATADGLRKRAASPGALAAGFGGGFLVGRLCVSRGKGWRRLRALARLAWMGPFTGLAESLVMRVLRGRAS
ncbi:MAG TPA: hypothetical protein VKA14_09210 [Gammaproteobacteria bacterium]|nr:hypothetical protein [Gammaproteobacteria bacterium]